MTLGTIIEKKKAFAYNLDGPNLEYAETKETGKEQNNRFALEESQYES